MLAILSSQTWIDSTVDDHLLTTLLDMALVFGIAGILVPAFQRISIPPVLGYLLCGIAMGSMAHGFFGSKPHWLAMTLISDTSLAKTLGEFGVIALMFMIGLRLSLRQLMSIKHYVLGLGSAQIMMTTVAISCIALLFDNSLQIAILVGASLALSSTAMVMQLLEERDEINQPIGKLSFSILLMQDLAVVPILVLINVFSADGDEHILISLAQAIGMAIFAVIAMILLGRLGVRPLFHSLKLSKNPEWLLSLTLFMAVMAAVITYAAGLSAALGAFLAGLVIAETEYQKKIDQLMIPLKGLLMGIFFFSVGMMIDVNEVMRTPGWLFLSVAGIFTIKVVIIYPLCRCFRISQDRAIETSVVLAQGGEFAFVILTMAWSAGMLPTEHAQFFLLVTALSMVLTPINFLLAPYAGRLARHLLA